LKTPQHPAHHIPRQSRSIDQSNVHVLSGEQDLDRDAYARSSAAPHRQQRAVLMAQLQIMDPQGAMVYLASRQVSFRRAHRDLLAPFARSPGVALTQRPRKSIFPR
jgi:hypothetical protein